jgi:hypothetical protein
MSLGRSLVRWLDERPRIPPATRVVWLGLFCWAVTALLPSLYRAKQLPVLSLVLLPLAPGLLGLGMFLTRSHPRAATYVLLSGFPVAIALSMSRLEHELALSTYSPAALLFSLGSLGAYAASASQLGAAREPERSVDHKPLGEVAPVDPEGRRQRVGLWVLGLLTAGACAVVLWGSWQPAGDYRDDWGRAAANGAVLTALLAGLLGCLAIALVAPGLRAKRKRSKRERARYKNVARLVLTGISFLVLYMLARTGR